MYYRPLFLLHLYLLVLTVPSDGQIVRTVGKLQEVFAWKQITYNIAGNLLLQDRFGEVETEAREKRQADSVFFDNSPEDPEKNWNQQVSRQTTRRPRPWHSGHWNRPTTSTTPRPDDPRSFFIQYNNLPMGVEKVGNRVFIALPRRRYGIPSTLTYVDIRQDQSRSPALRPYPDLLKSRALTSVYRTRADDCGRLWMVDTGLLEIPNNPQQVQQPAVVIYDLTTDQQLLRYPLKSSDLPAANTPTGLASIAVDIPDGDCANAYAYMPDLTTFGLIVFSLREHDSWRLTHNYFSFNPVAGNFNVAGQKFQWSDGIFSLTLTKAHAGCRTAYFHAMVGTTEFSVSTCVLRNRTASQDSDFYTRFAVVGDRGADSQSTMHGYHADSNVVFYADIGRDAVSCWNAGNTLSPATVGILARDNVRLSYPSDLHVTKDEVWVMANTLPRWGYSRLDTDQYNFYVYKANVQDLIEGTVCSGRPGSIFARVGQDENATATSE